MKVWVFSLGIIAFGFACRSGEVASNSVAEVTPPVIQATPASTPRVLTQEDREEKVKIEKKMLKGDYLHDGSGILAEIGDMDSVPALLVVLHKYPSKGGGMICTKAHAISALRKITGQNLGDQAEDWEGWWKASKSAK